MSQPHVLIVDGEPLLLQDLQVRCESLGLRVRTAADGLDALTAALAAPPDLLITDVILEGADGLSVLAKLRSDSRFETMKVILFTNRLDKQVEHACRKHCATTVHKGHEDWDAIARLIRRFFPELVATHAPGSSDKPEARKMSSAPAAALRRARPLILLVDDDMDLLRGLSIRLRACGVETVQSTSVQAALRRAIGERPDVIVTDFNMPCGSGLELLRWLKADDETRSIPILVLSGWTGSGAFSHEDELIQRGAAAYLRKPPDFAELLRLLSRYIDLRPVARAPAQT